MDLDFSARASQSGTLLDPVTGQSGSLGVGLNFGSGGTISSAGAVCATWAPVTGESLTADLTAGLDITVTAGGGPLTVEQVQTDVLSEAWTGQVNHIEVALVADPLAIDGYGNPISASRASEIIFTAIDDTDVVHVLATLNVTDANEAAFVRRVSKLQSLSRTIKEFSVTGVTANACKVYIHFGGLNNYPE